MIVGNSLARSSVSDAEFAVLNRWLKGAPAQGDAAAVKEILERLEREARALKNTEVPKG